MLIVFCYRELFGLCQLYFESRIENSLTIVFIEQVDKMMFLKHNILLLLLKKNIGDTWINPTHLKNLGQ